MTYPRSLVLAALACAAFVAGCGGDETPEAAAPAATETQPAKPEPKRGSTKPGPAACGDAPAPDDPASDQATKVKAVGVACDEALSVAAEVQEKMDTPIRGWNCPSVSEWGQLDQECKKGDAAIEWKVRFR